MTFLSVRQQWRWLAAAMSLVMCTTWASAAKPETYDIVLIQPPGAVEGYAYDLDSAGNVVLMARAADNSRAAFYYELATGTLYPLADGVQATGMNDDQDLVGFGSAYGVYWDGPNAEPVYLEPLTENGNSGAWDISDNRIVIGESFDDGIISAAVWDVSGASVFTPVSLPPLAGDDECVTDGISDVFLVETPDGAIAMNWVIGASFPEGGNSFENGRAVRWAVWVEDGLLQSSPAEDLGALQGGVSLALGVDDSGNVCGISDSDFAFLKLDGQPMLALDTPRRALSSGAVDLTSPNEIVGSVRFESRQTLGGESSAWMWKNGDSIDLNRRVKLPRGAAMRSANAIGGGGHICGFGEFPDIPMSRVPYVLIPGQ